MQILDLINSSDNILIVTEKQPDFSGLLCATFLVEFLKSEGKKSSWLLDKSILPVNFQNLISGYESNLIGSVRSNNFETQISSQSGVEDIVVEKQHDGYKLIFKTKQGHLKLDGLEIQPLQRKFDLIIFLSNAKYSRIIDLEGLRESSSQQEFIQKDIHDAIGVNLVKAFFEKKRNLSSQQATILLTAMLWEIKGSYNQIILELVNWLVFRCKADLNDAKKILEASKTSNIKEWKRVVYQNLKITSDLIYSFVNLKSIKAEELTLLCQDDKIPFAKDFETENIAVVTQTEESSLIFIKGDLIEKFTELESENFNINNGILTALTELSIEELKILLGIELTADEEHTSLSDISDELIPEIDEILTDKPKETESIKVKEKNKPAIVNDKVQFEKTTEPKQKVDKKIEKVDTSGDATRTDSAKPVQVKPENRNTSVLNHQKPTKVTKQFSTTPAKNSSKSYDPLPPADW